MGIKLDENVILRIIENIRNGNLGNPKREVYEE